MSGVGSWDIFHVLHIIVLELISLHVCFKTLVLISFKSITSNINYIHVSKNSKTKSQLHTLVALIPWLNSPAIFVEERSAIWDRAYWKNIRHFTVKFEELTILQTVHCLKLTLADLTLFLRWLLHSMHAFVIHIFLLRKSHQPIHQRFTNKKYIYIYFFYR